jgi:hypothetical protein
MFRKCNTFDNKCLILIIDQYSSSLSAASFHLFNNSNTKQKMDYGLTYIGLDADEPQEKCTEVKEMTYMQAQIF